MPVANRYVLPGSACHLTHRCHDRKFVNAVADANEWRARLEIRPGEGDAWLVRETGEPYGLVAVGAEAEEASRPRGAALP